MFSGIVETLGRIHALQYQADCLHLQIAPEILLNDLALGDSIAVNGVCLTITKIHAQMFEVTVVPETLRVTNLGLLRIGSPVNLERSVSMSTRIHGHYVQGHVDATQKILAMQADGAAALLVTISMTPPLAKYLVQKGYVSLDGMSITVIDVTSDYFTVTFIPYTIQHTIVQHYQVGTLINLEVDMMAKYIEKLLGATNANLYSQSRSSAA